MKFVLCALSSNSVNIDENEATIKEDGGTRLGGILRASVCGGNNLGARQARRSSCIEVLSDR